MLFQYVDGFLNHLQVEKNASGMTIVSYRTDLNQFFEFLSELNSLPRELVSKELFNHKSVRDYLAHLQNKGFSRSTMARKLATAFICPVPLPGRGLGGNPIAAVAT